MSASLWVQQGGRGGCPVAPPIVPKPCPLRGTLAEGRALASPLLRNLGELGGVASSCQSGKAASPLGRGCWSWRKT